MGKNKRHFKGNNASDAKRVRREKEEVWRSTRADGTSINATGDATVDNNSSNNNTGGLGNRWAEPLLTNAKFEAYYKAQHIVEEGEWDAFVGALREPLPACFRINSDYEFADALRAQLHEFAGQRAVIDDKEVEGVKQLTWYPGGNAYKLGYDRRTIRKNELLNGLHQWMMRHTDSGNITRQEAVSMVPPLALDVHPHHRCLDMCAAPGSKTSQLLEIVNRSLRTTATASPAEGVTEGGENKAVLGVVVANDADTDRAYMLVHQCRRINSPLLVVTTHQGQLFPSITDAAAPLTAAGKTVEYFDRVLCDAPCSGDGTLRKNPAIWGKWSTDSSVMLHPLQLSIAARGFQLLKPGGLMVYSTCSMSPIEDEAVVAELLRRFKGTIELVDGRDFVPGFKARPGLHSWHVVNDFGVKIKARKDRRLARRTGAGTTGSGEASDLPVDDSVAAAAEEESTGKMEEAGDEPSDQKAVKEEMIEQEGGDEDRGGEDDVDFDELNAEEARREEAARLEGVTDPALAHCIRMGMDYFSAHSQVPAHLLKRFRPTLFPPSAEEAGDMHLERCLRCLPHDEDTGGFFVATLRKIAPPVNAAAIPEEAKSIHVIAAAGDDAVPVPVAGEEEPNCTTSAVVFPATADAAASAEKRGGKQKMNYKGLVEFVPWTSDIYIKLHDFFGFTSNITSENFYVRNEKGDAAKSIYFVPSSVQALLRGDREQKLKVVALGVKVFERKDGKGQVEYRLLQEGMPALLPYITKRKLSIPVQDFCNMLGGGLVSFSTLSPATVVALSSMSSGVFICRYSHRAEDVLEEHRAKQKQGEGDVDVYGAGPYDFYATCWRGHSRTVNVMCGKIDIERIKHQLEALGVMRTKVFSANRIAATPANIDEDVSGTGTGIAAASDADILVAFSGSGDNEGVSELK